MSDIPPPNGQNPNLPPFPQQPPAAPTPPPAPAWGQPPQPMGLPPEKKKPRWGLILGLMFIFCFLPLGGCVAFIGFGVSEVNERTNAIESVVLDFTDGGSVSALIDGNEPCLDASSAQGLADELALANNVDITAVGFIERDGNSTFSLQMDQSSEIPGRPDASVALAQGTVIDGDGTLPLEVLLSKPGDDWKVCQVDVG